MEKVISMKNSAAVERANWTTALYKKIVLELLNKMKKGQLNVTFPNGETETFGGNDKTIIANIKINNTRFFKKIVMFGDVGFGEAYVDGDWDTDNITNVISWMILNVENNPAVSGSGRKFSPISLLKIINRAYHKFNINSKSGSKKNISEHYDLNNDFFKLWLDESMTYSSAIFEGDTTDLRKAQIAKYDRLCRQLKIKSTDNVLEIGTGWGGFSIYAAENYGCKITTITISKEQYDYAKNLVAEKNLDKQIDVQLKDYRDISGSYNKIVSIEMLEAVGHEYLPTYFSKVNELLKPDGAVGLQVITSHDSNYDQLRKGIDWIQKHIFPGSLLPSIAAINSAVNKTSNLYLHDLKNIGLDYALTLREWRTSFNSRLNDIFKLNFSNLFVRKWNFYFSYCEAAFDMRNISVVQMIYTRPNNRNL
ncbi:MAG: cyclopropane-fatty-acyl-phospholipid synthase [Ignavibacteriales bacterium]|nr:cyclopropane-fatty-acyl-phospholipid synthase [Ignavibacteriales bacterium]